MKQLSIINYQLSISIMLCALCIVLASCGGHALQGTRTSYPTAVLSTGDVVLTSQYSASIQGQQDIAILPQVGGFLTELKVHEGEHVVKGQTLFVIDSVNFAAALRVARANEQAANAAVATQQLTYDSKTELRKRDVISEYDLQVARNALLTAKANLAQAQAAVVNAKQNLSYTVVKSPCDGVVGSLPFRVGALVSPQMPQPLTTVSNNSTMYVYFSMSEAEVLSLVKQYGSLDAALKGLPAVRLRTADGALYAHEGRIESISGVIDRSTHAISLRAEFPNKERLLISGGSGMVEIPTTRTDVLLIPQQATFEIQDKVYVYKVVDGRAVSQIVTVTALPNGKQYIAEEGLTAGDVIVTEGAAFVKEGEEIE